MGDVQAETALLREQYKQWEEEMKLELEHGKQRLTHMCVALEEREVELHRLQRQKMEFQREIEELADQLDAVTAERHELTQELERVRMQVQSAATISANADDHVGRDSTEQHSFSKRPPREQASQRSADPAASIGTGTRVKLDVGGVHFTTSTSTLASHADSMLAAMFGGHYALEKDDEGRVFIDRDGELFKYVLQYLRDGDLNVTDLPSGIKDRLKNEAAFYCLPELEAKLSAPQQSGCSDVFLHVKSTSGSPYRAHGNHPSQVAGFNVTDWSAAGVVSALLGPYNKAGYQLQAVLSENGQSNLFVHLRR